MTKGATTSIKVVMVVVVVVVEVVKRRPLNRFVVVVVSLWLQYVQARAMAEKRGEEPRIFSSMRRRRELSFLIFFSMRVSELERRRPRPPSQRKCECECECEEGEAAELKGTFSCWVASWSSLSSMSMSQ